MFLERRARIAHKTSLQFLVRERKADALRAKKGPPSLPKNYHTDECSRLFFACAWVN